MCGTPDTRPLRMGVESAQLSPGTGWTLKVNGGALKVFAHNNTNICGRAGSPIRVMAADLSLRLVPYGEGLPTPLLPVAEIELPPLPDTLRSGDQAILSVTVDGWIPPGWYLAELRGTLQGQAEHGLPFAFGTLLPVPDAFTEEFGWTMRPVPGETSSLLTRATVTVRACNGTDPGGKIRTEEAVWQVEMK